MRRSGATSGHLNRVGGGATYFIRKHVVRASRLADLVALGSLTPHAAAFLDAAVAVGLNILVAGATQAGNATRLQSTPSG